VYVADRSGPRVFVISGPEQTVRKIEQTTDAESEWKVQDVTVDAKGTVYIVSSQGTAVHVYRRDGSHIRSFGRHGPKDDEFSFPVGAAIGPDGNLWIADSFRHELKVFTPGGRFLFRWGKTGMDDGELFYPVDIAFGKEILYVLEKGASRLQAFEMPGRR
jgi:sugar lactone lactonase YvrE